MRATYGEAWGVVYRVSGDRVDVSIYSIGNLDVSKIAQRYGGGGHRNAAGFSVPLRIWLERFV
jgi:nanoRNase/pAp phosphatase (c-di-AMP/oligoRNAs hydrolase)